VSDRRFCSDGITVSSEFYGQQTRGVAGEYMYRSVCYFPTEVCAIFRKCVSIRCDVKISSI